MHVTILNEPIAGVTDILGRELDLLALAWSATRVTVLGPTIGLLPDGFVKRGADTPGSMRITRPDESLDLLAEGDLGAAFPRRLGREGHAGAAHRRTAAGRSVIQRRPLPEPARGHERA